MQHYQIETSEGLKLLVGVSDYPVDFKIAFPNGKAVDFSFDAAPEPHSTVTEDEGLLVTHVTEEADTHLKGYVMSVVSQSPAGGPTIKYADATDDGSRPMVP